MRANLEPVMLFWRPGRTGCLRFKELLALRGVAFEAVER